MSRATPRSVTFASQADCLDVPRDNLGLVAAGCDSGGAEAPSERVLAAGAEHLEFTCNGCGDCCRRHRVALTHHDLARLKLTVTEPLTCLVDWLPPEQVELDAESASFVTLPAGPRLMVLRHTSAGCRFLTSDARCSVYSARPRDCELYPFVLERDEPRRRLRLTLFEPAGCGDRRPDAENVSSLERADARRWTELHDYRTLVRRWNVLARHQRRFGHHARTAEQFIVFLGLNPEPEATV